MISPTSLAVSDHDEETRSLPNNRTRPITLERNERIEHHLPLVTLVLAKVRRNLPAHLDADDLHSAGVTGLIAAAERFDPTRTGTFEGYACIRIRGAILDELRRTDPTSRRSRSRNREIQSAICEAEQDLGRVPTDLELSERLGIAVSELDTWRKAAAPVRLISLDAEAHQDGFNGGSSLHGAMRDESQECVRAAMEKKELVQILTERMAELPTLQKRILALYYFEGVQFSEIAVVFGISASRICQLHKEAVLKLGSCMRSARQS